MAISKIGSKGITDLALTADDLADGTISNDKLAGSIANDKLANSSVTLNGTAVSLGGTADIGTQWQAVKTADFTAVAGEGYFVDTTSGTITATLPASPSIGDTVIISHLDGGNVVTIGRNSSNINGTASDNTLSTDGDSTTLVYSNASEGWKTINSTVAGAFISATGGTVSTSGDYKIHTFTSSGCFVVSSLGNGDTVPAGGPSTVDYLVVAGGGGTGGLACQTGGGGGGGFRLSNSTCMPAPTTSPLASPTGLTVSVTTYPITVGGGGAPVPASGGPASNPGSNSVFSTITSAGGGGGRCASTPNRGQNGGSGGGSRCGTGATGNTPPVSPPQGNNGGSGNHSGPQYGSGGGGGAGAVGNNGGPSGAGSGGIGSYVDSSGFAGCNGTPGPVGSTRYFSGGGGGGAEASGASGGAGGGGAGTNNSDNAVAGTTNSGGGAGSGGDTNSSGAAGGSGIVIIRYKYQ